MISRRHFLSKSTGAMSLAFASAASLRYVKTASLNLEAQRQKRWLMMKLSGARYARLSNGVRSDKPRHGRAGRDDTLGKGDSRERDGPTQLNAYRPEGRGSLD
jgi:hypothetical protein